MVPVTAKPTMNRSVWPCQGITFGSYAQPTLHMGGE
jgi:hypothetical protein